MKTNEIYQTGHESDLAQLEKGVAPWKRPWATVGGGFPKNASSGRSYRGLNVMLLWCHRRNEGL